MACVAKGTPLSVRIARAARTREGRFEHRARGDGLRREEAVAREEEARVLIRDRERITVDAVAGAELALEIRGPQVVRIARRDRHHAGVLVRAAAWTFVHQPAAREQIGRRTRGRPRRHPRMPRGEDAQELPRSPEGMLPPERTDPVGELGLDPMRTVVRGAAPIPEPAPAFLLVAREPLVPDATTDTIPRAERRHREPVAQCVLNELDPLVHRGSLQPRHRRSSLN